jgi:hypothetical protein
LWQNDNEVRKSGRAEERSKKKEEGDDLALLVFDSVRSSDPPIFVYSEPEDSGRALALLLPSATQ